MNIFDRHLPKYRKMLVGGESQEKVARVMVSDERDALVAAECDVDDRSRERIQRVVEYGARELGVAPPLVQRDPLPGMAE